MGLRYAIRYMLDDGVGNRWRYVDDFDSAVLDTVTHAMAYPGENVLMCLQMGDSPATFPVIFEAKFSDPHPGRKASVRAEAGELPPTWNGSLKESRR